MTGEEQGHPRPGDVYAWVGGEIQLCLVIKVVERRVKILFWTPREKSPGETFIFRESLTGGSEFYVRVRGAEEGEK